MTRPWWTGMPAVETTVACGGERHRLRWSEGRLEALDHEDAEGERMMMLLGAEAVGCLDLIATWEDRSADHRLLAVAPRTVADSAQLRPADLVEVARYLEVIAGVRGHSWQPGGAGARLVTAGTPAAAPPGGGGKPFAFRSVGLAAGVASAGDAGWRAHSGLLRLFTLGRPFVDRLVLEAWTNRASELAAAASALETSSDDSAYDRHRPALLFAGLAMVRATVAQWLAFPERAAPSEVQVELVPGSALLTVGPVTTSHGPTGDRPSVSVSAGTDWLSEVWGRQLGVVRGVLATELLWLEPERAVVKALQRGPAGAPSEVEVKLTRRRDADAWIALEA